MVELSTHTRWVFSSSFESTMFFPVVLSGMMHPRTLADSAMCANAQRFTLPAQYRQLYIISEKIASKTEILVWKLSKFLYYCHIIRSNEQRIIQQSPSTIHPPTCAPSYTHTHLHTPPNHSPTQKLAPPLHIHP